MNWYKNILKYSQSQSSISINDDDERFIIQFFINLKNKCGFGDVIMRICGGWVRDHLLGVQSDDIDIALGYPNGSDKTITGEIFVNAIEPIANQTFGANNPIKKK